MMTDGLCSRVDRWQWYLQSRTQDKGRSYRGSRGGLVQIYVWGWYKKMFRKIVFVGLYFSPKVGTRSAKISASRAERFGDMERFCQCHYGLWEREGDSERERGVWEVRNSPLGNHKIPPQLAVYLIFQGVPKSYVLLGPHCHSSEGSLSQIVLMLSFQLE